MPNGRCYLHGGMVRGNLGHGIMNVGPANKARIARQKLRAYLGLKAPWGQRKGGSAYVKIDPAGRAAIARGLQQMADEMLPMVRTDGPLESYTHGELLARGAHSGLIKLIEVIERQRDPEDAKGERLAAEMGAVAAKLYAHIQEAQLRGQRTDQLATILRSIVDQAE